jgi:hypothetical protein
MSRFIAVVWATALAAASCNGHPADGTTGSAGSAGRAGPADASPATPPAPATPATSVLEQVQRSAPAGAHAAAADLKVTGIELFVVTTDKPPTDDTTAPGKLVGVAGGLGGKILEGSELMKAVIDAKADKVMLARIALAIAQSDAELLDAPHDAEQRKARVRPPAIARNALVFWVLTTEVPRLIERGTLDLKTGALELADLPVSHAKAIENAIASLTGVSVTMHAKAARTLAESCSEPRARAALLSALGTHPRAESRAEVADAVHKCGADAVAPLTDTMENDRSAMVRSRAATALGKIGDKRARFALAKAAKSEDANLAWAAKNALKKLE